MSPIQTHKYWYVVYTRSRAEKKVHSELLNMDIESFLPMQKQLRKWKDRKKWVEIPLISGYCFVYISQKEYDRVLQADNVVCYITFDGKAAIIPKQQIEALRRIVDQYDFEVQITSENYEPGQTVEIINGPLVGVRGELVDIRGKHKFLLRVKEIEKSFTLEVPASDLSILPNL